ncbi:hypothetical protein DPMN_141697 [Dreissena polymorpha]|uniref:Uncharacterized protein n=1 Tax=Dreissena polymorpha TaxID=45954 RepID=A0A9D4JIJ4_DREPO|nr:hypothetical protein DPMN_141697 [Dreissena polymorpha]
MFLPTSMTSEHPGSHVFEQIRIIFIHIKDIILTNFLTKKMPPTGTIFELVQDIIGMHFLTKFHDDWTINMASRVLTMKNVTLPWRPYIIGTNLVTKFHDDRIINVASRKNFPPPSDHVFKATETIFKLIQDIIWTILLTTFHEDRKINVASRVLTRKNAPPQGAIFSTNQHRF